MPHPPHPHHSSIPVGFGVACHLGVHTDLPSIGVAKKLLQVDGLENNALHKEKVSQPMGRAAQTVPAWVSPRDRHRRTPSSGVALPVDALIPALGPPCVPCGCWNLAGRPPGSSRSLSAAELPTWGARPLVLGPSLAGPFGSLR